MSERISYQIDSNARSVGAPHRRVEVVANSVKVRSMWSSLGLFAYLSHQGISERRNEDFVVVDPTTHSMVVGDVMGGLGRQTQEFKQLLMYSFADGFSEGDLTGLGKVLPIHIVGESKRLGIDSAGGCFMASQIGKNGLVSIYSGDVVQYLFRGGRLVGVTNPDVDQFRRPNGLYASGYASIRTVDYSNKFRRLETGDVVLNMSDGVTNFVIPNEIEDIFKNKKISLQDKVAALNSKTF